jgi:hypothetical protein
MMMMIGTLWWQRLQTCPYPVAGCLLQQVSTTAHTHDDDDDDDDGIIIITTQPNKQQQQQQQQNMVHTFANGAKTPGTS